MSESRTEPEGRLKQRQRLDELLNELMPMCFCLVRVVGLPDGDPSFALDAVYDRLASLIRAYDVLVDWDGPTYGIALPTVAEPDNLARRVERLHEQMSAAYEQTEVPDEIEVEIGAAIRTPGEKGYDLVARAEDALSRASVGGEPVVS